MFLTFAESKIDVLYSSGDATLRKDKDGQNFGNSEHMTITKRNTKRSRMAVMKFADLLSTGFDTQTMGAKLRLYIQGTDASEELKTVTIMRLDHDFDEGSVSWKNFHGSIDEVEESEDRVSFNIHKSHTGKTGQVDVSSLFRVGEDSLRLALYLDGGGHVKFASKDHTKEIHVPSLFLFDKEEL